MHKSADRIRSKPIRPAGEKKTPQKIRKNRQTHRHTDQRHFFPVFIEKNSSEKRSRKQTGSQRPNSRTRLRHSDFSSVRQDQNIRMLLQRKSSHVENKNDNRRHFRQQKNIQLLFEKRGHRRRDNPDKRHKDKKPGQLHPPI